MKTFEVFALSCEYSRETKNLVTVFPDFTLFVSVLQPSKCLYICMKHNQWWCTKAHKSIVTRIFSLIKTCKTFSILYIDWNVKESLNTIEM